MNSARSNLLFIYTDEQAYSSLATYDNRQIEMPNLNRLAEQSVVFDQAYVTQPVCTPSRSSLLTGLYPHSNGCRANNLSLAPDIPCLPEMLPGGAFATGHFGKWHLGDELFAQHGFDEWISIEDGYNAHFSPGRDRSRLSTYHHFLAAQGVHPQNGSRFGRGEAARLPEALGKPAYLAGEAVQFLRRQRDRPFALFVNFLEPHMPFFGPRDHQYDPADIPLPPNFDCVPTEASPLKHRLLAENYRRQGHSGLPLATEADWRRMLAHYWGLCSLVDTHVGTILNALDDLGLSESTLVVFTSDHGDMMGSHRLLAKTVMFEEATRVPLMIRLPGQKREKRITGPVSQIDLVPTLLDLMHSPVPGHLQGRSLKPRMESEAPTAAYEPVVIEWSGPNNGMSGHFEDGHVIPDWALNLATPEQIRDSLTDPLRTIIRPDGWKMTHSPLGEHELYNLTDDPYETRNRYGEPGLEAIVGELRNALGDWQRRTADPKDSPTQLK